MSEGGVHTHAPHEEFVQEAAAGHRKHHSLNQWVAIFTAILAAIGAIVSYQGTRVMNDVLLYKNDAILQKTHATDEWNYYQAVSTKAHIMEVAVALVTPKKAVPFRRKIRKYMVQKRVIKAKAEALEASSRKADRESARLNRPHTGMALSLIFIQIAISLASITALTGRKWLFAAAGTAAILGAALWGYALWLM